MGYGIITHKFYAGQGLHLAINLTKRLYNLKVETIWEDYALLEVEGLTGTKNYILSEEGLKGVIDDSELEENRSEKIEMVLRVPEYSSYDTKIFGSISHISTFIDSKMRGPRLSIDILSEDSLVSLKYLQTDEANIRNPNGKVEISTLVAALASVEAKSLEAKKVMISNKLSILSKYTYLRSLLLQNSKAEISSDVFKCDSIQGKVSITAKKSLIVDRLYAGENQIHLDSDEYQVKVESGSGVVKGEGKLELGPSHKGRLHRHSQR